MKSDAEIEAEELAKAERELTEVPAEKVHSGASRAAAERLKEPRAPKSAAAQIPLSIRVGFLIFVGALLIGPSTRFGFGWVYLTLAVEAVALLAGIFVRVGKRS